MTVHRKYIHFAAFGTGAFSFIIYVLTLAPSLDFIDAGELSAVAHTFGIAHPTGYPVFTMLAGLWSYLPFGDGVYRLNLLAAVLCSLAAGVNVHLLWFLLNLKEKTRKQQIHKSQKKGSKFQSSETIPDERKLVASVLGAIVIALSETVWKTALSVEVYSLHIALLSLVLFLFVKVVWSDRYSGTAWTIRWFLFAFTLGLAFTNHMTTILLAPAFLVVFFKTFGFQKDAWVKILRSIPAFLLGLLPYIYLPLRAASAPAMNWGNPVSWERFLWHISGKQYRVWIFSSPEAAKRQLTYFLNSFPAEFAYVGLALFAIGVIAAFNHQKNVWWWLVLLFAGCVFYSINYDIHDIDSYFLLAYIATGVFCAYGFLQVLQWMPWKGLPFALGTAAVVVGIIIGVSYSKVDQRGHYLVEDYTRNMFNSVKKNALILSYQWDNWVSASYYYQLVEGLRPDVIVIDKELLRRSWYLQQLKHNHPEVYRRSEVELLEFEKELYKFEHELPYDPREIEQKYIALIDSFISKNYADRPVYVTMEIEKEFASAYSRVPEGLALRLYAPADMPKGNDQVWDAFTFRPSESTERLAVAMQQMYANALASRGVYLHNFAHFSDAKQYFERALRFTPESMLIRRWIAKNNAAMQVSTL